MSEKIYACVTLGVTVHDQQRLKDAAAARAMEEGMSLEIWEDTRTGPEDDLRMLLDPGSAPGAGFSIDESHCTTY